MNVKTRGLYDRHQAAEYLGQHIGFVGFAIHYGDLKEGTNGRTSGAQLISFKKTLDESTPRNQIIRDYDSEKDLERALVSEGVQKYCFKIVGQ